MGVQFILGGFFLLLICLLYCRNYQCFFPYLFSGYGELHVSCCTVLRR